MKSFSNFDLYRCSFRIIRLLSSVGDDVFWIISPSADMAPLRNRNRNAINKYVRLLNKKKKIERKSDKIEVDSGVLVNSLIAHYGPLNQR